MSANHSRLHKRQRTFGQYEAPYNPISLVDTANNSNVNDKIGDVSKGLPAVIHLTPQLGHPLRQGSEIVDRKSPGVLRNKPLHYFEAQNKLHTSDSLNKMSGPSPLGIISQLALPSPLLKQAPSSGNSANSQRTRSVTSRCYLSQVSSANSEARTSHAVYTVPRQNAHEQLQLAPASTVPGMLQTHQVYPIPKIDQGQNLAKLRPEWKVLADTEMALKRLLPLFHNVNAFNFGNLLIEVMKENRHHVSLDDFYNLLYNGGIAGDFTTASSDPRAAELFQVILDTFRNAGDTTDTHITGAASLLLLSSVNYHELLRTFLAIKIISDALTESGNASLAQVALPRLSIYKIYYILCQQLIHKHPTNTNSSSLQQKLILGQSRVGKLTKLVYPNLVSKRLGKRGQSKYHCLGLSWNKTIVSKDILDLLELDLSELRTNYLSLRLKSTHERKHSQLVKFASIEDRSYVRNVPRRLLLHSLYTSDRPLFSFVDVVCTYPEGDCSPRSWKAKISSIPQQPKWAKRTMDASVTFLKRYNVDLEPLIRDFRSGVFSKDDQCSLRDTVALSIGVLMGVTSTEACLHLYLVVLLLVFPIILASDQEVSCLAKMQLRASLNTCITMLDSITDASLRSGTGLGNFTTLLGKMVRLNEMTLSGIQSVYTENVTRVIVRDLGLIATLKSEPLGGKATMEEIFIRGIVMSVNAYSFTFTDETSRGGEAGTITSILTIARTFVKAVLSVRDALLLKTPTLEKDGFEHASQDLPYKVFKLLAEAFHKTCLTEPLILQLPIPVITYIVLNITNEMQSVSFHDFGNRDPGLSKATFKTWWVFSTTFQEYMSIISEIIALSQRLA